GLGFRVQGSGFRVQGSGFRVQGTGFRVQSSEFRVQGSGFRVQGLRSNVNPPPPTHTPRKPAPQSPPASNHSARFSRLSVYARFHRWQLLPARPTATIRD
ncbi:hypothetical protein T484DRAFT_1629790, partial [Baffinella frigidus]